MTMLSPPRTSAGAAVLPGQTLLSRSPLRALTALDAAAEAASAVQEALSSAHTSAGAADAHTSPHVVDARVSMSPSLAAAAPSSLHADAVVTALAPAKTGTVAEVAVTFSATPASAAGATPIVVGTLALSVVTDLPSGGAELHPGSRGWGALLHDRLVADQEFADLIETYDGTIGLRIGGRELHIRCYRGRVLETTSRSIKGADFMVDVSGAEFVALMTADHNTFMESAMLRRLSSSGSGYEYLRMTSALMRIIDVARALAADAGWGYAPQPHAPQSADTAEPTSTTSHEGVLA